MFQSKKHAPLRKQWGAIVSLETFGQVKNALAHAEKKPPGQQHSIIDKLIQEELLAFTSLGLSACKPFELDPPPGPRLRWLDEKLAQHAFVVLLFYRGFW